MNLPLINYGFEYKFKNSNFVFHVVAHDEDEAKERVKLMGNAFFCAKLNDCEDNSPNV